MKPVTFLINVLYFVANSWKADETNGVYEKSFWNVRWE